MQALVETLSGKLLLGPAPFDKHRRLLASWKLNE
jgi:hypothetical protein